MKKMPIFGGKKKSPEDELPINGTKNKNVNKVNENNMQESNNNGPKPRTQTPKLIFQCQLAEGSHTAPVSGFSNMKELYEKIAENFNIPASEVSQKIIINLILVHMLIILYRYYNWYLYNMRKLCYERTFLCFTSLFKFFCCD